MESCQITKNKDILSIHVTINTIGREWVTLRKINNKCCITPQRDWIPSTSSSLAPYGRRRRTSEMQSPQGILTSIFISLLGMP